MLATRKQYIINYPQPEMESADDVGQAAVSLFKLYKSGVKAPESFVISSQAFDDFITAGDLVDKLVSQIDRLQSDDLATAEVISAEIISLIEQTNFPSIVLNPIVTAYKTLSGPTDKFVAVKPSWLVEEKLIPTEVDQMAFLDVKGEANLALHIKKAWGLLFHPKALLERFRVNYEGGLSMAVVVQKMVQAEVSGVAYSIDPVSNEKNIIEIQAIYGLSAPEVNFETQADIYRLDKTDLRVAEKVILEQANMFVRRARALPGEDSLMPVEISQQWRKKQKLTEVQMSDLGGMVKKLEEYYKYPIELHWTIIANQAYAISVREFKKLSHAPTDYTMLTDTPVNLQIIQSRNENAELEGAARGPITRPANESPDLDALTDEVNSLVENKDVSMTPSLPEPDFKVSSPRTEHANVPEDWRKLMESKLHFNRIVAIDQLTNDQLYRAQHLDGAYLDGTALALKYSGMRPSEFTEKLALDIVSAAKSISPKPLIYKFSDIPDSIGISGAEKFQLKPELLQQESDALIKAKNVYQVGNMEVILPGLNNLNDLLVMRKLLGGFGLQRSASLKMYAELSHPAFIFMSDEVSHKEIDGIWVNLPVLSKHLTGRQDMITKDLEVIMNAMRYLAEEKLHSGVEIVMFVDELTTALAQSLVDANIFPQGLSFRKISDNFDWELISHIGKPAKREPKKRGRPAKKLK